MYGVNDHPLNRSVMQSLTGVDLKQHSKMNALTFEQLQALCKHIKPLPTKRKVLEEFMEANHKNWLCHWLLLPEECKVMLDDFPGDMPEFAKFVSYLDKQVCIMERFRIFRTGVL